MRDGALRRELRTHALAVTVVAGSRRDRLSRHSRLSIVVCVLCPDSRRSSSSR